MRINHQHVGILSQKCLQSIRATQTQTHTWKLEQTSHLGQWTPTSSFLLTIYNPTVEFPRWTRFRNGFLTKWILFNIFLNIFCRRYTLQISAKITTRSCGRLNVKDDIGKRLTVIMKKELLKQEQKMEFPKPVNGSSYMHNFTNRDD